MSGSVRFGWPRRATACCGVVFAVALFAAPPVAQAANVEYCVTCKNPDASYRCRLKGSGVTQSDAFKLYCVVRTTKEGGHASCAAKKNPGCIGLVKVYQYDGPTVPSNVTNDPRLRQFNERVEQENRAFEDKRGGESNSLFELGGRAVDASKRGLRGAGAAIGLGGEAAPNPQAAPSPQAAPPPPPVAEESPKQKNFARRSYDCVMSLFRECGEHEGEAAPNPQAAPPPPPVAEESPTQRNFAHRSYDCVMSLFRECGENE